MPAPEPSLLPGQSPPFFTVTPTDQAGVIVNVAAICLILAAISMGIRAYVRFVIVQQRIAWDDSAVLLALLLFLIQTALVFQETRDGLGKTVRRLTRNQILTIQEYLYADDFFFLLSVWTTKVAFALLFYRTSPKSSFQRATKGVCGFIVLTGVVSILLITLRCDLSQPWIWFTSSGTTCEDLTTRWQAISALDIATESLLSALSLYLVWDLQMSFSRKSLVVFAFSLRLAIIAPIVCHLHYLTVATRSDDVSLKATSFVLCKQVELAYSVIAANIPVLRPFIIATATNYGGLAEGPKGHSGSNHELQTFGSKTISRRTKSNNNSNNRSRIDDDETMLNAGPTHTKISSSGKQDATSVGSNDSERMIIRKDVQYSVAYNRGRSESGMHSRESEEDCSGAW
ncbi:uncharacterized protein LTR77_009794 [Saxophila tyrrhenica]|uniref:Rhodopsin domain-containing protein n=1 Tax=Saxophila tyrrhenica TaxID=1690608 RepID=A0AAV9P148_9PEZI|nr:hypothetical protein LTR77_009794 [Saxophila tyrrhenica]